MRFLSLVRLVTFTPALRRVTCAPAVSGPGLRQVPAATRESAAAWVARAAELPGSAWELREAEGLGAADLLATFAEPALDCEVRAGAA